MANSATSFSSQFAVGPSVRELTASSRSSFSMPSLCGDFFSTLVCALDEMGDLFESLLSCWLFLTVFVWREEWPGLLPALTYTTFWLAPYILYSPLFTWFPFPFTVFFVLNELPGPLAEI